MNLTFIERRVSAGVDQSALTRSRRLLTRLNGMGRSLLIQAPPVPAGAADVTTLRQEPRVCTDDHLQPSQMVSD